MKALVRICGLAAISTSFLLAAGCEEKSNVPADAGDLPDSGPAKPDLGGKLGAAVAAAESAQAKSAKGPGNQGGPPETGIFPAGGADAALAPGAPPKVEVVNEGADPKVLLAYAPAGDEQKATITVGVRLAQGGLPAVDFSLVYKLDRPKEKKDKPDPLPVLVKVASVAPGKDVAGRFPKEIADALAKFKGTEIRYELAPNGAMSAPRVTLPKEADPKVDVAIRALAEAMTLLNVPLPDKAIGAGGYWMVTDRSSTFNMDVVRYRVFRVQSIEKDKAQLSVDVRQYSVRDEVDLGALANGQKIKLDRFDSQGKGNVAWTAGALLPAKDDMNVRVMIMPAGQRGGIPLEVDASTDEPAKDEKKK
ncbi:MAG: hypothetical protein U0359_30545 [Byssovorax sp.]